VIARLQGPRAAAGAVLAGGFLYGCAMGSFGGRALQALYAGLKVPLLVVVSAALCAPAVFVLNTLLGLRDDLAAVARGILASQAAFAIALASLAPLAIVVYASTGDYRIAVLYHGLPFAAATAAAQLVLARHYRPLIARNPRHRAGRAAWLLLYVFVAIQSAWLLRPYVGAPSLETQFFREEAWSNAYVTIVRALFR
jgi:hypothetical protein